VTHLPPPVAPDSTDDQLLLVLRAFIGTAGLDDVRALAAELEADDWTTLLARATAHGIASVVATVLTDVGEPVVPPAVLQDLADERRDAALRSLRLEAEVSRVLKALQREGVEPIVLKGLALACTLYPDPSLRPSDDLDLFVEEGDWSAIRDAMRAIGATADGRDLEALPPRLSEADALDHWLSFRTAGGLRVECALDPLQLGVRMRGAALLRERSLRVDSLPGARVLSPEDDLVMLAIHLNRHGFRRMVWLLDIALLLAAHPDLDWNRVREFADAESITTPVAETLRFVTTALGVELPAGAGSLRSSRLRSSLWRRYWPQDRPLAEGLHEGPLVFRSSAGSMPLTRFLTWTLINLVLMGRVLAKARHLFRKLLPSRSFLDARYEADAGGSYGRVLLRRRLLPAFRRAVRPLVGAGGGGARGDEVDHKFSLGVFWNTTAKMSSRVIQFLVTIVLARLLVPADFGMAQITAMVTTLVVMFAEFGFAHALIQKADVGDEDTNTAMTISVAFAAVLTLAGVALSPWIAELFHAPSVTVPLAVACLGMLIASFGLVPRAMLMKRFDFRSIAMADFTGCIAYGTIGVTLAVMNKGVWSLVNASLAMMACESIVLSARAHIRFRPLIHRESAKALIPFGSSVLGTNFVDFLRSNLDYMIVGRVLGPAALGVYTIAFRIADFPRSRLVTMVSEVAFSAMSSVQEQLELLRRTYVRAVSTAALVAFPLLLGFTAVAGEFIRVVYGPQWTGAVTPLRILLPMSVLLVVAQPGPLALLARGEAGRFLQLNTMYAVAVGVFAGAGVRFGTTGVALGVLAASVLYFLASEALIWSRAQISPMCTLRAIAVPAAASALMVVALLIYRASVPFSEGILGFVWLLGAAAVGAGVYIAAALAAGVNINGRRSMTSGWDREGEPAVDQMG